MIMPISRQLKELLDEHKVKYQVVTHSEAYTAQEVAQAEHISGKQVAKVVMVRKETSGMPVMLVLPATHKVDFTALRSVLGTSASMEAEREFRDLFPGCETGAEPPFGNLFGLETFVDPALTEDEEIVFNGGSHWQTIHMRYDDYARLVQPHIAQFAEHL
jgi:Ala-tRNA(Pro) deacylase